MNIQNIQNTMNTEMLNTILKMELVQKKTGMKAGTKITGMPIPGQKMMCGLKIQEKISEKIPERTGIRSRYMKSRLIRNRYMKSRLLMRIPGQKNRYRIMQTVIPGQTKTGKQLIAAAFIQVRSS